MSRSNIEPIVASLRKAETASLSEMVKPVRNREAMSTSTCSVSRGRYGQHVRIGRSRNLGDPAECRQRQHPGGMHNPWCGSGRKSDGLIVAMKRVTTVERRGLTVNTSL
jgi:hypothetical protein